MSETSSIQTKRNEKAILRTVKLIKSVAPNENMVQNQLGLGPLCSLRT